jgi:hypothetical protein
MAMATKRGTIKPPVTIECLKDDAFVMAMATKRGTMKPQMRRGSKKLDMMPMKPTSTKSQPPSRCVRSHTMSISSV